MPLTDSNDCDLIFYTNPMSRGQIARWMLEEIGAPYRQELLEYGTSMKSPEYLAINPMGKVPAIKHKGKVVTECAAICAYLADAFPEANLAPATTDRADYYRWLFFTAGPLESAVIDRRLDVEISPENQRMVGYGNFELALDTLSTALDKTEYIAGDSFTAADVYVGSQLIWGMQFGSLPKRSEFENYTAKLTSRNAYTTAKAIDEGLYQQ